MQYFGFDRPSFALRTLGFGDNFDPLELFKGGKQGVWYDPSDKSTLFQDVAGTVPVTKDGDPIGLMKDKSGNGYHATQSISAARPLYKTDGVLSWFEADGTDDWFKTNYTPSSDWSSHIAILYKYIGSNSFVFESYLTAANNWVGQTGTNIRIYDPPAQAGITRSLLETGKACVTSARAIGDGVGSIPIAIGARSDGSVQSYFFSGQTFCLVIINGISSAREITLIEQYLAKKSGVTL